MGTARSAIKTLPFIREGVSWKTEFVSNWPSKKHLISLASHHFSTTRHLKTEIDSPFHTAPTHQNLASCNRPCPVFYRYSGEVGVLAPYGQHPRIELPVGEYWVHAGTQIACHCCTTARAAPYLYLTGSACKVLPRPTVGTLPYLNSVPEQTTYRIHHLPFLTYSYSCCTCDRQSQGRAQHLETLSQRCIVADGASLHFGSSAVRQSPFTRYTTTELSRPGEPEPPCPGSRIATPKPRQTWTMVLASLRTSTRALLSVPTIQLITTGE